MKLKNITILILFVLIIIISMILMLSNFSAEATSVAALKSSQITGVKSIINDILTLNIKEAKP